MMLKTLGQLVELGFPAYSVHDSLMVKDTKGIPYSDYGTAFAKEWNQVFFHDPEENIIEVHQQVS